MTRATTNRARLPAFGREIAELRRRGQVPKPHGWWGHCVVCLDTWKLVRRVTRVVVTAETDPAALDYSMLAGLIVWIAYQGSRSTIARRETLIRALVRANVAALYVMDLDEPAPVMVIKSLQVGLERLEYA